MKSELGISIEQIELQGTIQTAFVFRTSRAKQRIESLIFLVLALASFYAASHTKQVTDFFEFSSSWSKWAVGIGSLILGLLFAFVVVIGVTRTQRSPLPFIALTREALHLSFANKGSNDTVELPWDEIMEISLFELSQDAKFLGVRVQNALENPIVRKYTASMETNRANVGWDFIFKMNYFYARPNMIETAAHYFFHNPEKRVEIGTEAGLATVWQLVKEKYKPAPPEYDEPSEDFFNPENHDELLNPELQEAIGALTQTSSPENRRKLFEVMLSLSFCVPIYDKKGSKAQFNALRNENGELVLAIFSDPAALRRYEDKFQSMLVLPAEELFKLAVENDFAELQINPAGPAGGVLKRQEFEVMAEGQIPE